MGVIITTTNNISCYSIKEYRGAVCANQVLDCFQRNRMNEFSDCGYNQIQQNNRFSTHKLMLSLIYRLNATRSKYKGTGAGKDAQARMGS